MKAVVYRKYGGPDVLELTSVPKPAPRKNEVLVRIHATTVTTGDRRLRCMDMPLGFSLIGRAIFGISAPRNRILGTEFSGQIEAVGAATSRFQVGDQVFGMLDIRMGAHAEYCCIAENEAIASKPEQLSHRQAAALSFGASTALSFLRRGNLRSNEKILINGASGCVGSAAIQIANCMGAEVVGVCGPKNAGVVKALGAKRVIDYTRTDFVKEGESYDLILDTVGNCNYHRCKSAMKAGSRLLLVAASMTELLHAPLVSALSSKRVIAGPAVQQPDDIEVIAGLAEQGLLQPVLDMIYPLEEIKDAHRHVDTGRKRGNVVVELIPDAMPTTPPRAQSLRPF